MGGSNIRTNNRTVHKKEIRPQKNVKKSVLISEAYTKIIFFNKVTA